MSETRIDPAKSAGLRLDAAATIIRHPNGEADPVHLITPDPTPATESWLDLHAHLSAYTQQRAPKQAAQRPCGTVQS